MLIENMLLTNKTAAPVIIQNLLYAWGHNTSGQLGDNTTAAKSSPVVLGALSWTSVHNHFSGTTAGAIRSDGKLFTWGANFGGTLGDGSTISRSSPVQIGTDNWTKVRVSGRGCLAIKSDGTLWGWGQNNYGSVGDGTTVNKSSPVQIGVFTDWTDISTGETHCLGVGNGGRLYGWGRNTNGQLGTSNTTSRSAPQQIGTLTTWTKVAAGQNHSMALRGESLFTWGGNASGQLGNGNTTSRSSPVAVGALAYQDISAGRLNGAALRNAVAGGVLFTWGNNDTGQLGQGTTANRSSPIQVTGSWSLISLGYRQAAGMKFPSNTIWTWGNNQYGSLGSGTTTNRSSPVQVGAKSWITISAGRNSTVGITSLE
jgi:alpha-tubulin suppressor-like RCC1 family protein